MKIMISVLALTILTAAAVDKFQIDGYVYDSAKKPIGNVLVIALDDDEDTISISKTNSRGYFELGASKRPASLMAFKEGYNPERYISAMNGNTNLHLHMTDKSLREFVKQDDQEIYENSIFLFTNFQIDEAISSLKLFVRKYPFLIKAHYNLGLFYSGKAGFAKSYGKRREFLFNERIAQKHWRMLLDAEPEHLDSIHSLAESLIKTDDITESVLLFKKLLKQRKDDHIVWYNYAEALVYKRDLRSAETAFRKVLELNSKFPDAYARLAALEMQDKKFDEAAKNLQEFLRLAPESDMADQARKDLQECLEKSEK